MPPAEIRASFLKYMVSYCRNAPGAERLLPALEPHREAIRAAPLLGWLPAELLLAVCEDVGGLLGRSSAPKFWRALMFASTDRALMAPLLDASVRLHGRTLNAMSRTAPQVWTLVTRGCGVPSAVLGDNRLDLTYGGLPAKLCRSQAFAWFLMGACHANAMLIEVDVHITVELRPLEIALAVSRRETAP
jgi:hypothetical protein